MRLADKTAIVIGAGQGPGVGIGNGRATALTFARHGAKVLAVDLDLGSAEETVAMIAGAGGTAAPFEADVTREDTLAAVIADGEARWGRIDILHNNVGISGRGGPVETSAVDWRRVFDVNVTSMFLTIKHTLPHFLRQGGGAIVNISSRSSDMVQTSFVAYGAAKAALNMMTRNLAIEVAPKVRVNAISVGGVDTQGLAVVLQNEELKRQFNEGTPMGRPGTPEDIAAAALFLVSDASCWVTGKIFQVDGGTEFPAISIPSPPL